MLAVIASAAACKQASEPKMCAMELAAPEYPPLAFSARLRLHGAQARVHIRSGRVSDVDYIYPSEAVRFGRSLFGPAIENAVRRSKFDPACGDRVETVVYDFVEVDQSYRGAPDRVLTSFVPPNKIVMASTGVSVQTSYESK